MKEEGRLSVKAKCFALIPPQGSDLWHFTGEPLLSFSLKNKNTKTSSRVPVGRTGKDMLSRPKTAVGCAVQSALRSERRKVVWHLEIHNIVV